MIGRATWKPNASTASPTASPISRSAKPNCGGIFDFEVKLQRLAEVNTLAEDPAVWSDSKRAQDLGREKKSLEAVVNALSGIDNSLKDTAELFDMARAEDMVAPVD